MTAEYGFDLATNVACGFDPTSDDSINRHKKLNIEAVEELCCCYRGMRIHADSIEHCISLENTVSALKRYAQQEPVLLPGLLQAVEWELGEVVKKAGKLLADAGAAITACHSIRAGNQTVISLSELKKDGTTYFDVAEEMKK